MDETNETVSVLISELSDNEKCTMPEPLDVWSLDDFDDLLD